MQSRRNFSAYSMYTKMVVYGSFSEDMLIFMSAYVMVIYITMLLI